MSLTRQEMFNRAVIGLASQKWERCVDHSICQYTLKRPLPKEGNVECTETLHCAWGWVDPALSMDTCGPVKSLHNREIGLAKDLTEADLEFAQALQRTHDVDDHYSNGSKTVLPDMRTRFVQLGILFDLAWPSGI